MISNQYLPFFLDSVEWLLKTVKNLTRTLPNWFQTCEESNQNLLFSFLRLIQISTTIEEEKDSNNSWISFLEFVLINLTETEEFYNLGNYRMNQVLFYYFFTYFCFDTAYLDRLLSTLTYVINKCQWKDLDNLLLSTGTALIDLIGQFYQKDYASFMGLSIIRNCVLCLNNILSKMQTKGLHLKKNVSKSP